jgi:hypothetical protein
MRAAIDGEHGTIARLAEIVVHRSQDAARPVDDGVRTSNLSSSSRVAAATASTASSNAAALRGAGAAARTSASPTAWTYGGRRVLMLRHMPSTLGPTVVGWSS